VRSRFIQTGRSSRIHIRYFPAFCDLTGLLLLSLLLLLLLQVHIFTPLYRMVISGGEQPTMEDKYSKMCHKNISILQKMFSEQK